MQTIRLNSSGAQVSRWQFFLLGLGYTAIKADGKFGPKTNQATIDFQQKNGLTGDGIVGEQTYLKAFFAGYNSVEAREYPGKPNFRPLASNAERQKLFGKFTYKAAPNGSDIIVTGDWATKNLVRVAIPQLVGVTGFPSSGSITFHKLAAKQLQDMFAEWEQQQLIGRIKSWGGAYVARFVRGSQTTLSNHAFGTAFDINVPWNGLGRMPALIGQEGSVRELVKIAHKHGFYWGGHFTRLDGMHFEVAKIIR
ncbi:MAG: M15 family metallopeptidase [Saprospiraceae bacterium]|nr:M15 family metallopeptidase [Saprospiraceae bacterium]